MVKYPREKLALALVLMLAALFTAVPQARAAAPSGYSADIHFDVAKVPFSRFGSYVGLSHIAATAQLPEGLYLRTFHMPVQQKEVFQVELIRSGSPVPFREIASPTLLRLEAAGGFAEITFADPHVLRVRGQGVELRFTNAKGVQERAYPMDNQHWEVDVGSQDIKYILTPLAGTVTLDSPWKSGPSAQYCITSFVPDSQSGRFDGVVEEFESAWHRRSYPQSFDASREALQREYLTWLAKMPTVGPEFQAAANLAAYANWDAVVAPEGHYQRPAMLMSKNRMVRVWAWDHCFNAMALIYQDPEFAWDQFFVVLDNQNADGALPDSVTDRGLVWTWSKPPIHGWAASWILRHARDTSPAMVDRLYGPLAKWTDWYFKLRDYDGDGLPQYNHGNDSGWDNSSVFNLGLPMETPDLSALLVLQMDALSQWAKILGKPQEGEQWRHRSDELLNKMLAQFWKDDHFVALHNGDHTVAEGDSLMLFLPVILGNRLPEQVRTKLVAGLTEKGRFLTEHGLATESLKSPFYKTDGYWLGPIWAPTTMMIAEGLDDMGEKALARDLRVKFCEMVAQSGMAENFDPVTGAGLRDPAYTWTSSVFLVFAHELQNP
jgi:hypothetical protein